MKKRFFLAPIIFLVIYILSVTLRSYKFYDDDNWHQIENKYLMNTLFYPLSFKAFNSTPLFDKEGVASIMLNEITLRSIKSDEVMLYSPVLISLVALKNCNIYLNTNNEKSLEVLIHQADWLVANYFKKGDKEGGISFSFDYADMKAPWLSGLSQGLALSVLKRAYLMTGETQYRTAMETVYQPLKKDVEIGGVKSNFGGTFFEEYPNSRKMPHVLNGFMLALIGVYEYYKVSGNEEVGELFRDALETLKKVLPLYDTGNWSRYSLSETSTLSNHYNYASPKYHKLHILLLNVLYIFTKEDQLQHYAEKFDKYYKEGYLKIAISPFYIIYKDFMSLHNKINRRKE